MAWKDAGSEKPYWMLFNTEGDAIIGEPHELCWRGKNIINKMSDLDVINYDKLLQDDSSEIQRLVGAFETKGVFYLGISKPKIKHPSPDD